ncbi:Uncharacterised protein [Acinetobacter baumannii]|nr:Uncharacterised protein [Acinetobacter baumannii]
MFSGWLIDNSRLLPECVRTQVKRAYESSVCLAQASTIETRLSRRRVCRRVWDYARRLPKGSRHGVRCVSSSFHNSVEIS